MNEYSRIPILANSIKEIDSLIKYFNEKKNKIRIEKSIKYQSEYNLKFRENNFMIDCGFHFQDYFPNFSDYLEYNLKNVYEFNSANQTIELLKIEKFDIQMEISKIYLEKAKQ